MHLYIWNYIDGITHNWHDGGGLVICTTRDYGQVWKEVVPHGVKTQELPDPDHTIKAHEDTEEFYEIFPDTGCC